jgi:hypothetical protein
MIININEKLRINSETQQWQIQKLSGKMKTGEPYWKSIYFYSNLQDAAQRLFTMQVMDINSSDIQEILNKMDSIGREIKNAVRPFDELELV